MLMIIDIDAELQTSDRDRILLQITVERDTGADSSLHPSLSSTYEPIFSPLMQAELERIGQKQEKPPGTGIDLSRYEASALELPARTSPHSDEREPNLLPEWRQTLRRAYGLDTFLNGRLTNLSLLETYGKNAWLIGNSQLEDELESLERELTEAKIAAELVEEERRRKQDDAKGEMEGLDESWRIGVRGLVEVALATEGLRKEILQRRRAGAAG